MQHLLFIILVLSIGGYKGFNSLVALSFTAVTILFLLVPLILKGVDPVFSALIILSIVILVSFLLISGFTKKSMISVIGTIGGVIAAGLISSGLLCPYVVFL